MKVNLWHLKKGILLALLLLVFVVASLVQAAGSTKVFIPFAPKNSAPRATTSYYITGISSPQGFYDLACAAGKKDTSGIIVLSFGKPTIKDGKYGTILPGSTTFAATVDINYLALRRFITGYYECSPPSASITIAVGTTNCGSGGSMLQVDDCIPGGGNVSYEHGKAWAQLVNDMHTWINQPPSYASKVTVVGAIDIEPAWNYATDTRNWVRGYDEINTRPYYNFGSCDGCPNYQAPSSQPGSAGNVWTLEDIQYVSYEAAPAIPLPQIYTPNGTMADQWYIVKADALAKGKELKIKGVMTQYQACQGRDCPGIDNRPEVGWLQMFEALNSASAHSTHNHGSFAKYDTRAAQTLEWSTDITW